MRADGGFCVPKFPSAERGARLCELFTVDQVSHEKGVRTGVYFKHNLSYQVCKGKSTYQENTDSS